jgi:hypothetical protein
MEDLVLAANNNANNPISIDGHVDPCTLVNITGFGTGIIVRYAASNGFNRAVVTCTNGGCLYTASGSTITIYRERWGYSGALLSMRESVFTYSIASQCVNVYYVSELNIDNCEIGYALNLATLYAVHMGGLEHLIVRDSESTLIDSTTTVIRNCSTVDNKDEDSTNATYASGFKTTAYYVTIEDYTMIGHSSQSELTADLGGMYDIYRFRPIEATVRNCFIQNWNRGGVVMGDERAPSSHNPTLTVPGPGTHLLIENAHITDCGNGIGEGVDVRALDTSSGL